MINERMSVLVTGGAGFIGSHVVDTLLRRGYAVRVLDNLSSGKLSNIASHVDTGRADFVKGDIKNKKTVKNCIDQCYAVIHLAARVSVPLSFKERSETFADNYEATKNLLQSCVKTGVKKVLFASSSAVYGEQDRLPIKEEFPLRPKSPYAESKVAAEFECNRFLKSGLSVYILRLFNVYGPRQGENEYSGVITKFVNNVKNGLPIIVYGDGSQTRDFVSVFDVADVFLSLLEKKNAQGDIFNIGTGKPTSINELAEKILQLIGSRESFMHGPLRLGDIRHSFADISKAERVFGFKPTVSLTDGLRSLIE